MSHVRMSYVTHTRGKKNHVPQHEYRDHAHCEMSHMMHESCHTYERVMPRNTGGGGSTDHAKVGLYSPLVPSALRS